MRKVLSFGFYFSNKYDLTLSRIKLASNHPTDTHFQWNAHMFKEILAQNIDKKWQTLLIQVFPLNLHASFEIKKNLFYNYR